MEDNIADVAEKTKIKISYTYKMIKDNDVTIRGTINGYNFSFISFYQPHYSAFNMNFSINNSVSLSFKIPDSVVFNPSMVTEYIIKSYKKVRDLV